MARKTPKPIKDDPRVVALANCVIFARNAFRNKPVFDSTSRKMEGWHAWFERALAGAGYEVEKEYPAKGRGAK